jgi:hypothetical protein
MHKLITKLDFDCEDCGAGPGRECYEYPHTSRSEAYHRFLDENYYTNIEVTLRIPRGNSCKINYGQCNYLEYVRTHSYFDEYGYQCQIFGDSLKESNGQVIKCAACLK